MGELTGVELQNIVYFLLGLVSLILAICLVRREEGQAYVGDILYGIHRSAIFVSVMWMTAQACTFFSFFACSSNSLSQNLLLVISDSAEGAMSLAIQATLFGSAYLMCYSVSSALPDHEAKQDLLARFRACFVSAWIVEVVTCVVSLLLRPMFDICYPEAFFMLPMIVFSLSAWAVMWYHILLFQAHTRSQLAIDSALSPEDSELYQRISAFTRFLLFNTVLFGAIAGAQIWVVAVYLLSAEGLRRPYFGRPARYDNFGPGIAIVLLSAVTYSFYTARARAKSRANSAAMLGIGDDGLITAATGQLGVGADDTVGARLLSDADVAAIFSARAPLSPLSPLQLKPGRSHSFSLGHMAGHGARSVSAAVDVVRPSSVMHSGAAVFARET